MIAIAGLVPLIASLTRRLRANDSSKALLSCGLPINLFTEVIIPVFRALTTADFVPNSYALCATLYLYMLFVARVSYGFYPH